MNNPSAIASEDANASARASPRAKRLAWTVVAISTLATIEAAFSTTSLITPISNLFLNSMRGLGAVAGLLLGLFTVRSDAKISGFRKVIVILFSPVMIGFLFDGLAWRVADWWEFGLSSVPFERASYPVMRVHWGRKGARDTLEIDPFHTGEAADIPIPSDQYRALRDDPSEHCVVVLQRRSASDAIEIKTDGAFTFQRPVPATVLNCASM